MTKDGRLYGKFSLDFPDSHKIMPLSDAAFRCLVEATLWSRKQLSDGLLPKRYAVARWSQEVLDELASNDPANPSLIEVDEGWMIHDFAEHQTTKADIDRVRQVRKEAGRRGGHAKAAANRKQVAKQVAKQSASKTCPETETNIKNSEPLHFDNFWNAYPRKVGRKEAVKSFKRALSDIDADQLVAAAKSYADAKRGVDPQFIALPTTWLNQGRWDEFTASAITPEQFLKDCWTNATLAPIEELTGRKPECIRFPDPIPSDFDKATYLRDFRRSWIEDHRMELVAALEGRL